MSVHFIIPPRGWERSSRRGLDSGELLHVGLLTEDRGIGPNSDGVHSFGDRLFIYWLHWRVMRAVAVRRRPSRLLMVSALAVVCLIWGTTWAVIQVGLRGIPPFSGVAMKFALASALLFAVAAALGIKVGTTRKEIMIWLGNGLLSFTIAYGAVYWSEQWVPSGLAAILFAIYPLVVTGVGHFVLSGERLTLGEILGIVVGFAGVGVIFSEDLAALGGDEVYVGAVVMLLSPISAAFGTIVVKRWGTDIHPFSLAGGPMAVTAVVMGAIALWLESGQSLVWNAESIGALLYLAICGSAVTFFLYYWLLSIIPAKRLALTAYIIPLIAVAVGILRGEELLHPRLLAGAALVMVGVALAVHRSSAGTPLR